MANNNSGGEGCATFLLGLVGILMAVSVVIYIVEMIVRTVVYVVNAILAFFGNILIYLATTLITLCGAVANLALYLFAGAIAIAPAALVSGMAYFLIRQIWAWCRHHHVKPPIGFGYMWCAAMGSAAIGLGLMIGYSPILLWSAIGVSVTPWLTVGGYNLIKKSP